MSRPKLPRSATRIEAYIDTAFGGNVREAARVLGVEHVMLWRAARGFTVRGPGVVLLEALAKHSGQSMSYWSGRANA